jgi:GrpB-like predicted nucleotidyltransferase (UPF0157 family)
VSIEIAEPNPDWPSEFAVLASRLGSAPNVEPLVVGPPEGERPANVHVRAAGSPGERYALLFRDFLRADRVARDAWASYKLRLAALVTNLEICGQVKDPATDVRLLAAEA